MPTLEVTVQGAPSGVNRLIASVEGLGHAVENWTRNVRMICTRCSEGSLHTEHPEDQLVAGTTHFLGIASRTSEVESLLNEWAMNDDCELLTVDVGL